MTLLKGASLHSILGNWSHNWSTIVQPHVNVIYMKCLSLSTALALHGHFHTEQAFQSMLKYLNVHKM